MNKKCVGIDLRAILLPDGAVHYYTHTFSSAVFRAGMPWQLRGGWEDPSDGVVEVPAVQVQAVRGEVAPHPEDRVYKEEHRYLHAISLAIKH